MGVYMYSQTCIERSPSGDGFPQNRGNIKNDEKCHFMPQLITLCTKPRKKILTLISGEKHG